MRKLRCLLRAVPTAALTAVTLFVASSPAAGQLLLGITADDPEDLVTVEPSSGSLSQLSTVTSDADGWGGPHSSTVFGLG